MNPAIASLFGAVSLSSSPWVAGQTHLEAATGVSAENFEVRPPVTAADLQIVRRARKILDSPGRWNRADTRVCPEGAATFSLYCALEKATKDVTGGFEHRGAAMQEARFAIEQLVPDWEQRYRHRLMDYNNDARTTFADIQRVLQLTEDHIAKRLGEQRSGGPAPGGR
jgi:hypothetical protein